MNLSTVFPAFSIGLLLIVEAVAALLAVFGLVAFVIRKCGQARRRRVEADEMKWHLAKELERQVFNADGK